MRYLSHIAQNASRADTLIVLLPGAYQLPEDFIAQGFVSALEERDLPIDLIMSELSFDHIADRTALTEIHQDLILPAIKNGYKNIWLAGISVGGYVAIAYTDRYANTLTDSRIQGLLLMAPYPGNRMTTGEIRLAGGLPSWQPDSVPAPDSELAGWYWLKHHAGNGTQAHLGYGREDRFAPGHDLMAQALPADHVDCIAGGHDWPVWLQLWQRFLDRDVLKLKQEAVA